MRGLAYHHGVAVQRTQVGGPDHLLQQLAEQRCGNRRNPLLVAKSLAQFADFQRQAIAVIRLAAAHITLGLQGLQQPANRGPVQPALLGQLRRTGPAIENDSSR